MKDALNLLVVWLLVVMLDGKLEFARRSLATCSPTWSQASRVPATNSLGPTNCPLLKELSLSLIHTRTQALRRQSSHTANTNPS